jgi:ribosomal protein S21
MPIVIKSGSNDSASDTIRKFKKAAAATDIVQRARDRRFFQKPSKLRAQKKIEKNRLRRKARSLKQMKNISNEVIEKIRERIQ